MDVERVVPDAASIPRRVPARVSEMEELQVRGPWATKSGGVLHVLCALPIEAMQGYLTYDADELARVPCDIRGFRCYTVGELPKGRVGGSEFHRIRNEFIVGLTGGVTIECEDVWGNVRTFAIAPDCGIRIPPFILHTYTVREEGSRHLVFANTLFDPNDHRTFDTFSCEIFQMLQKQFPHP